MHDSFPRSGSHFLGEAIKQSFPNYDILWGQHIINNIRKENNVITVIRNPVDAIPSWIYFRNLDNLNISDTIGWYIRWMDATELFKDRICIITFNMLITDVNLCMKIYSDKFNLNCNKNISNNKIIDSLNNLYNNHLPREYPKDFYLLKNKVLKNNNMDIAIEKFEKMYKSFNI